MAQIPHADEGLDCPLWKKDVSQVCHACPWWIQIRGKHPQHDEEIDRWGCAVGWLPMLLIEGAQQTRQAGAAIESFRNEMVQGQAAFVEVIEQRRRQVANSE
jgi:hypothetical protein